jgi:GMP synthase-like glutamine amidotransferase
MKKLRIHYLQHVSFEGLGHIENWVQKHGHQLNGTRFYLEEKLPEIDSLDWLIIMGGPMGVYDEDQYAWLIEEKAFIKLAIEQQKTVIGICLGSQLIASALGAKVYSNKTKEIGWFPVSKVKDSVHEKILQGLPETFIVMHWHGDTFDLPEGAVHLLKTDVCANQAFIFKKKVLGLQFHLESTPGSLAGMIKNCGDELVKDVFIQSADDILQQIAYCEKTNKDLEYLLNYLCR